MSTKIEWCEETWNPVTGCTPISEGCKNCYAKRRAKMLANNPGIKHPERYRDFKVSLHPERLDEPLHWKKPRMIFVDSMGDLFHKDVEQLWIDWILNRVIHLPEHTFIFLTKRPRRMKDCLSKKLSPETCNPLPNLWLGVTAENQKRADERIPILLEIPAAKRFVSIEPMLGPVKLFDYSCLGCGNVAARTGRICGCPAGDGKKFKYGGTKREKPHWPIDWIIVGGESGPGARPMHPDWPISVRDQCKDAGVPFFFKQWGNWARWEPHFTVKGCVHVDRFGKKFNSPGEANTMTEPMVPVGKKKSGNLLDGVKHENYPD